MRMAARPSSAMSPSIRAWSSRTMAERPRRRRPQCPRSPIPAHSTTIPWPSGGKPRGNQNAPPEYTDTRVKYASCGIYASCVYWEGKRQDTWTWLTPSRLRNLPGISVAIECSLNGRPWRFQAMDQSRAISLRRTNTKNSNVSNSAAAASRPLSCLTREFRRSVPRAWTSDMRISMQCLSRNNGDACRYPRLNPVLSYLIRICGTTNTKRVRKKDARIVRASSFLRSSGRQMIRRSLWFCRSRIHLPRILRVRLKCPPQ